MKKALFIIVGLVSIGLSINCFEKSDGYYVAEHVYGGDAYTGMQNAAAQTGQNVKKLADIERFGFGSVLLIAGLSLIAAGIPENKNKMYTPRVVSHMRDILRVSENKNETTPAAEEKQQFNN